MPPRRASSPDGNQAAVYGRPPQETPVNLIRVIHNILGADKGDNEE
ncbi:MAG: hypothetical protein ACI9BV_003358 [Rhodothermales bacterium]|jgi:hypothetical protein